jgi:radical SAM enzyme (TIGR01210 family)
MKNPFLSRVALRLRHGRPAFPSDRLTTIHHEVVGGRPFVRLWFLTEGCTHDRRGHCTMCNYGIGTPVRWDAVVDAVAEDLAVLDGANGTLLLSPSGSMFDEREVPADIRRELFALAARSSFEQVLCESRPESLTEAVVAETTSILPGKQFALEMGLESSDPWVLRWCVNKGLELATLRDALVMAARHGVPTTLNVCVGTAFLTVRESIEDALAAVRWGLGAGASDIVLFPLLVRDWTVLAHLHRQGLYEPPSLWSLVDVLGQLGPDLAPKVSIAWYRDYSEADGGAPASMAVRARPGTCPRCEDAVLGSLDAYRDSQDFAEVAALVGIHCACRIAWLDERAEVPSDPLEQRVGAQYAALGRELLGEAWWERHGVRVLGEIPPRYAAVR